MSDNRKKQAPQDARPPDERRRIGTVVHDDRGNASLEWGAAPTGRERPVLEVEGENRLTLKSEEISYDPYARHRPLSSRVGKRSDLRKLGEWIKKMRELEERRRSEGGNGADEE